MNRTALAVSIFTLLAGAGSALDAQPLEPPKAKYYLQFYKVHPGPNRSTPLWAPDNGQQIVSDAVTVEAWVKWDGRALMETDGGSQESEGHQTLLCGQGAYGFRYDGTAEAWTFFLETTGGYRGHTLWFDLPTDSWTHLATTYDGDTIEIYHDGVLWGVDEASSGDIVASGDPPAFVQDCCNGGCTEIENPSPEGAFELGMGYGFAGAVREVRLWNRVLSQPEIATNAGLRLVGDEPGLIGYWPLDDGAEATQARNLVPGGSTMPFNALILNTPYWQLTDPYFRVREDLVEDLWDDVDYSQDFSQVLIDNRDQGGMLGVVLNGDQGCCNGEESAFRALVQQPDGSLDWGTGALLSGAAPVAHADFKPTVADFNGDGLDDAWVPGGGADYCVPGPGSTGARNELLLSDATGLLHGSRDQILSHPCTATTPAFPGQHPCRQISPTEAYYPDLSSSPQPWGAPDGSVVLDGPVGDIDGDGDIDAALFSTKDTPSRVPSYFMINDGNGGFLLDWDRVPDMYHEDVLDAEQGPHAFGALLEDMDGDGAVDLIVSPFSFGDEYPWAGGIFWNDGTGHFFDADRFEILPTPGIPDSRFDSPYQEGGMATMDIEGDGDLDLLLAWNSPFDYTGPEANPGSLQLLVNQGGRTFTDETVVRLGQPPQPHMRTGAVLLLRTPDVNNDGCPDLILGWDNFRGQRPISWIGREIWLNDCRGEFVPVPGAMLGKPGMTLLPFDFDEDGDIDFLTSRSNSFSYFLGTSCDPEPLGGGEAGADWHDYAILENLRPIRPVLFDHRFESGNTAGWSDTAGAAQVTMEARYEGSYGLRVTAQSSCALPNEIVLDGETLSGGVHEACALVTVADSQVTGDVTLRSGGEVRLGSDFSVTATGRLGVELVPALFSLAYVQDDTPSAEPTLGAEFWLRLDDLALADTKEIGIFAGYSHGGALEFGLILQRSGSDNLLYPRLHLDNGSYVDGASFPISNGWHELSLRWEAAVLPTENGFIDVYLDDALETTLEALDNHDPRIDRIRLGIVSGIDTTASGFLDFDLFEWWR